MAGGGACMAGGIPGEGGGMCGRGACMAGGLCMAGVCMAGACMVRGACMVGGAWEGLAWHTSPPSRYYEVRSMSRWYASYWNAFLSNMIVLLQTDSVKRPEG